MLIEARRVGVTIDGRPIVQDQSLTCPPGAMTGLVGPSGSGKTTLLHALGLLQPITTGEITADGGVISGASPRERRRFWRDHAAFVLQDYGIIDDESVAFNVTLRSVRGRSRHDQRLLDILARVGLEGLVGEPASHLSGGEKQRLALARAMYRQASVLLIDEPTASLDADNRRRIIHLFSEFADGGATVIVATHDEEMMEACSHVHRIRSTQHEPTPAPA